MTATRIGCKLKSRFISIMLIQRIAANEVAIAANPNKQRISRKPLALTRKSTVCREKAAWQDDEASVENDGASRDLCFSANFYKTYHENECRRRCQAIEVAVGLGCAAAR